MQRHAQRLGHMHGAVGDCCGDNQVRLRAVVGGCKDVWKSGTGCTEDWGWGMRDMVGVEWCVHARPVAGQDALSK